MQDPKGFIWIGCDAGLYKFDGVRYTLYKCPSQKSKSITGLTIAASGKMYCFNFQSQLFYLENDSLREIKHSLTNIANLVSDLEGNIYISHMNGISSYNEQRQLLTTLHGEGSSKATKGNLRNPIFFLSSSGIANIKDKTFTWYLKTNLFANSSPAGFEIEYYNDGLWIFSKEREEIYTYSHQQVKQSQDTKLNAMLKGRKITDVKMLSDSNLWICTYKGIICYDSRKDSVRLFYPELSFSDCLIDHDQHYWFSTLQTGLLRVPNLNFIVWNRFENTRLTKIANDSNQVYFSTINGFIGQLNTITQDLKTFYTGNDADVQSLDYIAEDQALWFNINNSLFQLKKERITQNEPKIQTIKSLQKVKGTVLIASSHGFFVNGERISTHWARAIHYDTIAASIWVASNQGLRKFKQVASQWVLSHTFFDSIQIISMDFDAARQQLYTISFDGNIYVLSPEGAPQFLDQLPNEAQAYRIRYNKDILYIASNKGIFVKNLKDSSLLQFRQLNGLASDNVQDLTILNQHLWLATGKGLQQILQHSLVASKTRAKIYLKNKNLNPTWIELQYGQNLLLFPEASAYSSDGKFQYAYRINNTKDNWTNLPASVQEINIQNIPVGNFEIELKAIDYFGQDSENTILLRGYVSPLFWQTWWFLGLGLLLFGFLVVLVAQKIIANIPQTRTRENTTRQFATDRTQSTDESAFYVQYPQFYTGIDIETGHQKLQFVPQ